jgi:hypothetical protein
MLDKIEEKMHLLHEYKERIRERGNIATWHPNLTDEDHERSNDQRKKKHSLQ